MASNDNNRINVSFSDMVGLMFKGIFAFMLALLMVTGVVAASCGGCALIGLESGLR